MTLFLALLSFHLPAGEGAVVMLSGIPAEPWAALSTEQIEEMWTFGIEGYQVTRSGWSGYILRGPGGSRDIVTELCETLVADRTEPDSSLWSRTLQLIWNSNALPAYYVAGDSLQGFPVVPVRTSRWLEAGADTLILSLPVENTVLFWAGGYQGSFNLAAWRGVGTEVVPSGSSWAGALVTSSIDGSPNDVINLEYAPAELDSWWGENWAPLLSLADSMVASQFSRGQEPVNSVLWIRGTGGERMEPWKMIPSPTPEPVARYTVEPRPGIVPLFSEPVGGEMVLEMPGNAGSAARAAYAAALLERIVARMALPATGRCRGEYSVTGEVRLHISGVDWTAPETLGIIMDELTPIIFTAPEGALMNNAAVRAGIPVPDQRETIELLAGVTGFFN